jgi:hypothetical protein
MSARRNLPEPEFAPSSLISCDGQGQKSVYFSPIIRLPIKGDVPPVIRKSRIDQQQFLD